jgi:outer membrane protein
MHKYKHFSSSLALSLTLFTLVCAPVSAKAESGETLQQPVYVIDMQRIVAESIAGKAARNNVEEAARKKQAALKSFEVKFTAEREKLAKQKSILSGDAFEEKLAALKKRELELKRKAQDSQEELSRLSQKQLGVVVDAADDVIKELGKEKGYAFILERDPRLVVYTNEDYDLTQTVIDLLDKKKIGL